MFKFKFCSDDIDCDVSERPDSQALGIKHVILQTNTSS